MPRRDANRSKQSGARLNATARRGLEVVFWIVFVLAIGIGGPSALSGLPDLANVITPAPVSEAQASAGWQDVVLHPLGRTVRYRAVAPDNRAVPLLPAIALLIDDMGGDMVENRRAIALPQGVSLSFLPDPADTPRLAEEARRAGHEILVHVPMESPRRNDPSLRLALRRDLPAAENVRRLEWALSRVPGYTGINNHEGSLFTADRQALIPVVEALYGRGVFFLDSRTTPLTQIVPVARAFRLASSDRDVFLDDDQSPSAVEHQLAVLERTAQSQGVAIAIGHPHTITLDLVTRWCANLNGYRLVPVSTAIRLKTEREMRAGVARK